MAKFILVLVILGLFAITSNAQNFGSGGHRKHCNIDCRSMPDNQYTRNPDSCTSYCNCVRGDPILIECPSGKHYDASKYICSDPAYVNCMVGNGNGLFGNNNQGGHHGGGGGGKDDGFHGGNNNARSLPIYNCLLTISAMALFIYNFN